MEDRSGNNRPNDADGRQSDIDAVVAAYLDALEAAPDPGATLADWQRRYPTLAAHFALMAVDRAAPFTPSPVDPATAAAVDDAAARLLDPAPAAAGSASLADLAHGAGWTLAALAERLRVPPLLLERLDERRVEIASLPIRFVGMLSEQLGVTHRQIVALISGLPPHSAAAAVGEAPASYRAAPRFDDLLAEAGEDDRAYWARVLAWSARLGDVD